MARFNHYLFIALFLTAVGLIAWLSTHYSFEADWTHSGRNSLSETSSDLLATLNAPVKIEAFVREEGELRRQIESFIDRYQRSKGDIEISFINPDLNPQRMRELNLGNGALLIHYQGRSEQLQAINEQNVTNALRRLSRSGDRWIAYLEGHGERDLRSEANHALGSFGSELERKGFKLQPLNLAKVGTIPGNTELLVIASPQLALLEGEVALIEGYLQRGGNLLWLTEPGSESGLEELINSLGITKLPGTLVDTNSSKLGIYNPAIVVVPDYPFHAVTSNFTALTLYPQSVALEFEETNDWQGKPLITTLTGTWNETSEISGAIAMNAEDGEREGPFNLALALTRTMEGETTNGETTNQRAIVIGDGDFLSNSYLGNGGNLDLGLAMVEWLSHDDALITIRSRTASDTTLELSNTAMALIGFGFLFLVPVGILSAGLVIWIKRRKR